MSEQRYINLEFVVKKTVGDTVLEYHFGEVAQIGNERFEFNRLMSVANDAIQDYIDNFAHSVPELPPARKGKGMSADNWIRVDRLIPSLANGQYQVKALCGPYQKYGLVVWPEILALIGWNNVELEASGIVPKYPLYVNINTVGEQPRVVGIKEDVP